MIQLIRSLVRPYRGTLLIILAAMLVETAMSVAGPWPLKIILDNVVGSHKLAPWLNDFLRPILSGGSKMQIAAAAAIAAVIIAVLGAIASYVGITRSARIRKRSLWCGLRSVTLTAF